MRVSPFARLKNITLWDPSYVWMAAFVAATVIQATIWWAFTDDAGTSWWDRYWYLLGCSWV